MSRTFDYEHVVTFDETNVVGNVYFTNHLRWQGHCRELFLRERAPGVLAALADGLVLVTTRCSCDYFAELAAFDRVTVRMSLAGVGDGRVTMRFEYVRSGRAGEETVARGEQQIACLRRRNGGPPEPVDVPEELRAALAPYATAEVPA
jgi:enediyne core biosynthesis thioesterase